MLIHTRYSNTHLVLWYAVLPLQTAFALELVFNYAAAFAGMLWFLRRLRCSMAAALFGAMLFAFSGFNLLHHHHLNMVAVVAHLPALLAASDWLLVETRPARRASAFAAVALILGSEFLIGFPQAVWWNTMALAAFVVYRCAEARRWRAALPCAAAFAIGVALGAIQLLPSADAAARSLRLTLSRDFALTYSLHPYNVFQLWSPYFFERGGYGRLDYPWFHELGIYSGAILTVAPIYVWIRRRVLPERRTGWGAGRRIGRAVGQPAGRWSGPVQAPAGPTGPGPAEISFSSPFLSFPAHS